MRVALQDIWVGMGLSIIAMIFDAFGFIITSSVALFNFFTFIVEPRHLDLLISHPLHHRNHLIEGLGFGGAVRMRRDDRAGVSLSRIICLQKYVTIGRSRCHAILCVTRCCVHSYTGWKEDRS